MKSKLLKKLQIIILSRFKKPKNEKWIKDRRIACFNCEHNTNNTNKLSIKLKIMIILSDFYTWITLNEKTNLGNCKICTCDLYYKTSEITEICEARPTKWKSIYKPNSAQK